jgi:two-component system, LytTR family, sensor kinase
MPAAPTAPKHLLRLGIFGVWVLFTLMVVAISWAGAVVRGRPPALGGMLIWNLGWLFWAGGTFVVVWLARRFPVERATLARSIAAHCAFGIALGVMMLGLEFIVGHALALLWPAAPRANPFLGFIVYKFHVYFLIYWMILGATRAFDFHTKYRETELRASQLDAQLAQAQLQALKTQLQPHFLFNTHHAIISLMLKQDTAAAIKMLTRLSDLLRLTLRQPDQQVSSLRDELDALDLYLGIQRERYGDRLRVQKDIDPAALVAEVPWLLLQPLVENALKHGIDPVSAGGTLRLRASIEGDRLVLNVSDDGAGFRASCDPDAGNGIGLRNTRARLARLYGADHTLELRNLQPGGAEVRISLPRQAFAPETETPHVATTPTHA